jgi:lactate racemase
MAQVVELPWGEGSLEIKLPTDWRILGELRPHTTKALDDVASGCRGALSSPTAAGRLSDRNLQAAKIAVVVDDHSRPTPVKDFIAPVLEELAKAGAVPDRITILIATGVHRASRPEEIERKVGRDVLSKYRVVCHDGYDENNLVELGVTTRGTKVIINKTVAQADLVVCLGSIEPHLLLGFGGGLKMIIPGCAGAETIGANHLQNAHANAFDFVGVCGHDSPMRLDLEEGAAMLKGAIFIVNCAMNEKAEPTGFFCGDPVEAHRAGERFVEEHLSLFVPEQADGVLANSFPMELDLRQSIKCVGNSLYACKPGGVMMGCLKCEHGVGEMPQTGRTLPYPVMRGILRTIGKHRILPLVKKVKAGQPVEEVFIGHFGLQMLRRNHLGLFTDSPSVPADIGRKMGLARSFDKPDALLAWAAKHMPKNPSIWIFPYGGATYARPTHLMEG